MEKRCHSFWNKPSKYERKRAERKKRGGGLGGGMFRLPDVFTTFPYSFLTVALLAAGAVKLSERMWTRIPPGVKNTYLNNTCTPVHHTWSEEYVSEQYMHSCSSHLEWRIRIWTIHIHSCSSHQEWRIRIWSILHSCLSHQDWRIRIWTIHTLLFITPGLKDTYLNNTYTPVHHTRIEGYVSEQYIHSSSSHHEWGIRICTTHSVHSCSSHQEWRIRIWTIHTLLFTTPRVKDMYLQYLQLSITPGIKDMYQPGFMYCPLHCSFKEWKICIWIHYLDFIIHRV